MSDTNVPNWYENFNGNKRTGHGRNHKRIPASRRRELDAQTLQTWQDRREASKMVGNLTFVRKISRLTNNGYPAWRMDADDDNGGKVTRHIFQVHNFDEDTLAQFGAAGFDLEHMLMWEVVECKILVRWKTVPVRRNGLDAQAKKISSLEKICSANMTLYAHVEGLMKRYGYTTKHPATNNPHAVVSDALGSNGLYPYLKTPGVFLTKVEDWLAKWQLARAAMKASEPAPAARPIVQTTGPILSDTDWCADLPIFDETLSALHRAGQELDQQEFPPTIGDIYPQNSRRAYFEGLLADVTPAPTAPLLLPAFSQSTLDILKRYDAALAELQAIAHLLPGMPMMSAFTPDRLGVINAGAPVPVALPPSPLPMVACARPMAWAGQYEVVVDGAPLEGVILMDIVDKRRDARPSAWTSDATEADLNDALFEAFNRGVSNHVRPN